jgi:dihydropteroate synthase
MAASVAAAALAVQQGAKIIRAHDVAATVDAVNVARAFTEAGGDE